MIAATRSFLILLLILAYAEDRWLSRWLTIACAVLGWLVVCAVSLHETRRRR